MADDRKFVLTAGDADFLRMLKAAYDNGELRFAIQPPKRQKWQTHGGEFGKANAAISATTDGSTVLSHGTCTLWTFTSSTGHSIAATTETIDAYNQSTIAVTTTMLLQFKRHIRTGMWLIINPSTGGAAASTNYKPLIRFTLTAALGSTEASEGAVIASQYGDGLSNSSTAITVHNLLTATAGTYVFSGSTGNAGLAVWDSSNNYRIIQMECP